MKTLLTALLFAATLTGAWAQSIGLVTDTNGNIVTRRTNTLTFTNPLTWTTNVVAATRTNLGLGWAGTDPATTLSNLFASNSLPSGAAVATAPLEANGSGGSAFVPRVQFAVRTNDLSRSNIAITDAGALDTDMQVTLDANTTYRLDFTFIFVPAGSWRVEWSMPTNSIYGADFGVGAYGNHNYSVGAVFAAVSLSRPRIEVSGNLTSSATNRWSGSGVFRTHTNGGTMTLRWAQFATNATNTTLISGSSFSVTKLSP